MRAVESAQLCHDVGRGGEPLLVLLEACDPADSDSEVCIGSAVARYSAESQGGHPGSNPGLQFLAQGLGTNAPSDEMLLHPRQVNSESNPAAPRLSPASGSKDAWGSRKRISASRTSLSASHSISSRALRVPLRLRVGLGVSGFRDRRSPGRRGGGHGSVKDLL